MNRRQAIAALMSLPATAVISEARVRANDVIVCELEELATDDTVARIADRLRQVWPDNKVLVLHKGVRLRIARNSPPPPPDKGGLDKKSL